MKSKDIILKDLPYFTGTEKYHRFSILFKNLLLTDGCKYLADSAECYWLFDIIGSVQNKLKHQPFQTWTFDGKTVICTDGNETELYRQEIKSTDFPLDEIKLFLSEAGEYQIVMLPSEY